MLAFSREQVLTRSLSSGSLFLGDVIMLIRSNQRDWLATKKRLHNRNARLVHTLLIVFQSRHVPSLLWMGKKWNWSAIEVF